MSDKAIRSSKQFMLVYTMTRRPDSSFLMLQDDITPYENYGKNATDAEDMPLSSVIRTHYAYAWVSSRHMVGALRSSCPCHPPTLYALRPVLQAGHEGR